MKAFGIVAVAVALFSCAQPMAAQRGGTTVRIHVGPNHLAAARDTTSWLHEGWIATSATNPSTLVGVYKNGKEGAARGLERRRKPLEGRCASKRE